MPRLIALTWLVGFALQGAAALATPVTGWLRDTSFGGGAAATLTAANTNSPILGSGASNNADNVAIYAPLPLVSLAEAQQIVLTGSAEMIGTASVGDFRWGLFKDDGVAPDTAGWLGYFGSAESNVWSKDPTGTSFATTTFASIAGGRGRPRPNERTERARIRPRYLCVQNDRPTIRQRVTGEGRHFE